MCLSSMSISTSMILWWMQNFSLSPKGPLRPVSLSKCLEQYCSFVFSVNFQIHFCFSVFGLHLFWIYTENKDYNGWQWASEYSILNPSMRSLNEASPFPAQSPLVLVSYLFHKQKKISKLGWAAIWQSVCLKLIFNTRTKNIRYLCTDWEDSSQCLASWHSYTMECYS